MSLPQIQGTPLLIDLSYVEVDATPPATPHELLGSLQKQALSTLSQSEQNALQQLLATSLDQVFNGAWSDLQSAAQDQITQKIMAAQSAAHDIQIDLPQTGTLRAGLAPPSPQQLPSLPPGIDGTVLWLEFSLGRVTATFKVAPLPGLPDGSFDLSFDLEIDVAVIVPSDPTVPLLIWPVVNQISQMQILTSNFLVVPANFWAGFYTVAKMLGSLLEGNGLPNSSPADSRDLMDVPLQMSLLFGTLSGGFARAAQLGFTQMGVRINTGPQPPAPAGNTVEIDLTHPADPGPLLQNALVPPGPVFLPPQIGLTTPAVPAGSQVGVNGSSFAPGQASVLMITWTDTTSGTVAKSEVRWGPTPSPGMPPAQPAEVTIDRASHDNTFTATGLDPGTEYAFLVRDFDADGCVATGWSVPASLTPAEPQPWDGTWTFLRTQATDQVDLVLSYQATDLGTATLQTDGTFAVQVTVPASVPPGTYLVSAMLAGQPMAQAPITVLAPGEAPPPVLQVIDSYSNLPFQGTATVVGGVPVDLRGQNFTPGTVHLWVDAVGGTSMGTATA
ncbi:MAG TPA: fibronectin type III domain-containing protein, partial [Streptosporangiaceae bacterium]